jgi:hypothetical protein
LTHGFGHGKLVQPSDPFWLGSLWIGNPAQFMRFSGLNLELLLGEENLLYTKKVKLISANHR